MVALGHPIKEIKINILKKNKIFNIWKSFKERVKAQTDPWKKHVDIFGL